jgi:hypothetical protein
MNHSIAESPQSQLRQVKKRSSEIQKFLAQLKGFVAVQMLLSLMVMTLYWQKWDQTVGSSFMAATIDKHHLLAQHKNPRMIFVGGSSAAFGMDSRIIQQQLKVQPINMGINGGIGAEFMLNEVKADLKPGDVVVVSLEYESFRDFPPNPKFTFDAIEAQWQNAQFLPVAYIPALLDKGLMSIGSSLRRTLSALHTSPERKPYYARSGFNQFGDMTAHYALGDRISQVTEEQRNFRFTLNSDGIQRMINALNAFYQVAQAQQAKVIYVYPPLLSEVFAANQSEIQKLDTALHQSLAFPILDRPEDAAYPENEHFDTRYHLNRSGSQKRTHHLVRILSAYSVR